MASPLCLYYLKRGDVVICDYAATVLLLYEAPPSGQDNKQFCKLDLWRPELLAKQYHNKQHFELSDIAITQGCQPEIATWRI